jgi:hypothetical protein
MEVRLRRALEGSRVRSLRLPCDATLRALYDSAAVELNWDLEETHLATACGRPVPCTEVGLREFLSPGDCELVAVRSAVLLPEDLSAEIEGMAREAVAYQAEAFVRKVRRRCAHDYREELLAVRSLLARARFKSLAAHVLYCRNPCDERRVLLDILPCCGHVLRYASRRLRSDREVVLAAVRQNGHALCFAAAELRADREVALVSVRQDGETLQHVPPELRDDADVVLAAVLRKGYALHASSERLRSDRDIVLAAVRQNGVALQFASAALQADRAVVLAAVQQAGEALKYASEECRSDRGLVLAAVRQNGVALQFAVPHLRADAAVVFAAVHQSGAALRFAAKPLWHDGAF